MRRYIFCLASLVFLAPAVHAQFLISSCRSLDAALAAGQYVAKEMGSDKEWAALLDMAQLSENGAVRTVVDSSRSFGVYLNFPEPEKKIENLNNLQVVAFVPFKDQAGLLKLLETFGDKPAEKANGLYEWKANGVVLSLRFANGYAYFSQDPAAVGGSLPDPIKMLPPAHAEHLLTTSALPARIPKKIREYFRDEAVKWDADVAKQVASVLADDSSITQTFDVSLDNGLISFELITKPSAGSVEAELSKKLAQMRSLFGQSASGGLISIVICWPQAIKDMGFVKKNLSQFLDPKQRSHEDLIARIFSADDLDGFLVVREGTEKTPISVAAGLKVNGRALEEFIRNHEKSLPKADRGQMVRRLPEVYKDTTLYEGRFGFFFGLLPSVHFGVRHDCAVGVLGGVDDLKRSLDNVPDKPRPVAVPFRFDVAGDALSLAARISLMYSAGFFNGPEFDQWTKQFLSGQGAFLDRAIAGAEAMPEKQKKVMEGLMVKLKDFDTKGKRVRIESMGGETMRMRVEVDASLLRLLRLLDASPMQ